MTAPIIMVRVPSETFSVADEYSRLIKADIEQGGAVAMFVGRVRGDGDGDGDGVLPPADLALPHATPSPSPTPVQALSIEHYPAMTEKSLTALAQSACARWPLLAINVVHRVGTLAVGAPIVFVGVLSRHRASALSACDFLMDHLKSQAPFWKKAHTAQGEQWIAAKASDEQRLAKWQKNTD